MSDSKIRIGNRDIGPGEPVFVIAEAGVNHNGKLDLAFKLVEIAATAGADAVKFQTFVSDNMIAPSASKAEYQKLATGSDESQLEMIKNLELTFDEFRQLKEFTDAKDLIFLSTPFDFESVDFLDELGIPLFKISSGDLTNQPLLQHTAEKLRPMILSTGMADLAEVEEAVTFVRKAGNKEVAVLQCVTNYPAPGSEVNLRAMQTMRDAMNLIVGYSDHTVGIEIPLAATALGASIIEKHFTLDKTMAGPDHSASLEPDELRAMIAGIRKVESALGSGVKIPAASEAGNALIARRSLVAACDISRGATMTADNVGIMRPGTGLPPKLLTQILGRVAKVSIPAGTLLSLEMFD